MKYLLLDVRSRFRARVILFLDSPFSQVSSSFGTVTCRIARPVESFAPAATRTIASFVTEGRKMVLGSYDRG